MLKLDLWDPLKKGNSMRRRDFLTFCGAAAAGSAFPGVVRADEGEVVIAALGGTLQDNQRAAYVEPFEKATGVKARLISYTSISEVMAQSASGKVAWDVVYMSGGGMISLQNRDALAKIEYGELEEDERKGLQALSQPYGAPDAAFTRTLAYNTKKFTAESHPRSWVDVWDVKKYPGPRSLGGFSGTLSPDFEFALLADGVPMDKLYPLDMDRAFASLNKIRPSVVKFWETGALAPQMLTDGEAVIVSAYANRIDDLRRSGAPVAFEWDQGMIYMGYWGILKGARNFKNAMKFIAYATKGKSQATFVSMNPMGPANTNAFKYIEADKQTLLPTSPANIGKQFVYNDEWWAKNRESVQKRWDDWILGG
jgi:putative spermidine/putrescine transport system substrate-binding protein